MVRVPTPVFFTATTVFTRLCRTRLFPKSKKFPLNDALADASTLVDMDAFAFDVPAVAESSILPAPVLAAAIAEMEIVRSEPALSVKLVGVMVTPAGIDAAVTVILPLKLPCGNAAIVTLCAAPPGVREIDADEASNVNPGAVAGTGAADRDADSGDSAAQVSGKSPVAMQAPRHRRKVRCFMKEGPPPGLFAGDIIDREKRS